MLLTAALVALGALPVYVGALVLAGGLLLMSAGTWRRAIQRTIEGSET